MEFDPLEKQIAAHLFRKVKFVPSSEQEAFAISLLRSAKEGHLCQQIEGSPPLPAALWSTVQEGDAPTTPFVVQSNRIYLQKNWMLETAIVKKVQELVLRPVPPSDSTLFQQGLMSIQAVLQDAQRVAIEEAFQKPFSLFTGGPGTGKTYTAGHFIRLLALATHRPFRTAIAAPTGKAAAHLESSLRNQGPLPPHLSIESTTLHRLLRLQPGQQKFFEQSTIDADLVVIDEASMLDSSMLLHLLYAIGPNTRLLLLGDPDQLPPIEAGSLFAELADLFGLPLTRSLRLGTEELISLAQSVKEGDFTALMQSTCRLEWEFSPSRRSHIIDQLIERLPNPLHAQRPDPSTCLQEQSRFRILCGLRQGLYGVDEINRLLLERFQAKGMPWLALPILITKNDPRQNLYNGTPGILIRRLGVPQGMAYFSLSDQLVELPESALPHYEVAFCLSIHKSQGSEYEEVLALFPPGSERFGKEALYTAITRAKKKALLVMDGKALESSRKSSGFTGRICQQLPYLSRQSRQD